MYTVYDTTFATLHFSTLTSTCAREEKIRKRGLTRGETQRKKVRRNGCLGGEKGHQGPWIWREGRKRGRSPDEEVRGTEAVVLFTLYSQ